jgi:chromosome segregation ATPase
MAFTDDNLKHLERSLRKHQEDAAGARRQAEAERDRAQQFIADGNDGQAQYHNRAAERLEEQANELENEMPQIESLMATKQKRIDDLQAQRDQLTRESTDRITAIDRELNQLRGSTFSF